MKKVIILGLIAILLTSNTAAFANEDDYPRVYSLVTELPLK